MNEDSPEFGPCCCCGRQRPGTRNILTLARKAPSPGTGWGCLQCGLPSDGAIAVICDRCSRLNRPIRWVCRGYAAAPPFGRVPIDSLSPEPFEHDLSRHPEYRVARLQMEPIDGFHYPRNKELMTMRDRERLEHIDLLHLDLFAWLGEGERGSRNIQIKEALVVAGLVPLAAVARARVDQALLRSQLQDQADRYGSPIRLCRFQIVEVLDTIEPRVNPIPEKSKETNDDDRNS